MDTPFMSRLARLVLLATLSVGAFLVGVELLVTAVALPAILADFTDWTQPGILLRASWIVNGYLVAYIAVMPLAGRAADRFRLPTLYGVSLGVFAIGSVLSGAARDLDWLIGARVLQGLGAGAIVPLATAGASHLFDGSGRARAIGTVTAANFLGMAAGPFIGAAILQGFQIPGPELLTPAWRWIFYLGAPVALLAGLYTWASSPAWRIRPERVPLDILGALGFTTFVATSLVAFTIAGQASVNELLILAAIAAVAFVLTIVWLWRARDPFLNLRLFGDRTFTGAVLLSLLTGYALATALIGGAVFIDRVRYAGPTEQQLCLGGLAVAVALGALASGVVLRWVGVVLVSLIGLALSIGGLVWASTAGPTTELAVLVGGLAVFGLGFGLTVTARSTAAVEAVGRNAFGAASAAVTVARMLGMAIGLAALTVLGSNRIEALSVVLTDQAARDAVLPPSLQGRPLQDYIVVNALEAWAAQQAAGILSTLFVVAAVVTALAIVPTLAMRNRPAQRADARPAQETTAVDGIEETSPRGYAI